MNESTKFFLQLVSSIPNITTLNEKGNISTTEILGKSSLPPLTNGKESHLEESQDIQQNLKVTFNADETQTDGFSINNDVDQTKFNEGQDRKTKELWEKLLKAEEMLQEAEEKLLKTEDLKTQKMDLQAQLNQVKHDPETQKNINGESA